MINSVIDAAATGAKMLRRRTELRRKSNGPYARLYYYTGGNAVPKNVRKVKIGPDVKFIESYGELYKNIRGDKYWDFSAYHDFADTKQEQDFVIIQSFENFGEYNITPK